MNKNLWKEKLKAKNFEELKLIANYVENSQKIETVINTKNELKNTCTLNENPYFIHKVGILL